jgi:hypothetical protein
LVRTKSKSSFESSPTSVKLILKKKACNFVGGVITQTCGVRSAGASRPQPIPDVLQLPLPRGQLELLHQALAQKRYVSAAVGLALE